jgi:hypothetical protein
MDSNDYDKQAYDKQAQDFLDKTGTTFKAEYLTFARYFPGDTENRAIYLITLRRGFKMESFRFGQSIVNSRKGLAPTPYEFLACLTTNPPGTFDNFCDEYGYSQQANLLVQNRKIYRDVCNEFQKVKTLFEDVLDDLQEIQ